MKSFVRQLNLYGFRKIKEEWRFKHENFRRGRPDLLANIRKANQVNTAEQEEIEKLKKEVANLKKAKQVNSAEEIKKLKKKVSRLKSEMGKADTAKQEEIDTLKKEVRYLNSKIGILSAVVRQMSGKVQQMTGQPPSKKRKVIEADHVYPDAIRPEASLLNPAMVSDADLLIEDVEADDDMVGFMFDFANEDTTVDSTGFQTAQDTFGEDSDSEPGQEV